MKLQAVGDYIIVKTSTPKMTDGGIHIPAGANPIGMLMGEVVSEGDAIRPGFKHLPFARKGEIVAYLTGMPLGLEGEELEAVLVGDIVAVLKSEEADKEEEETP